MNLCSVFLKELHIPRVEVSFELFRLFSYRLYTTPIILQEHFVNAEALISVSDCLLKAQVVNVTLEDLGAEPRMHTIGNYRPLLRSL
jgi:hypothetical protein